MMLTLKQQAALHVAKLVGTATLGAVLALTFVHFFGFEVFFIIALLSGTIYALYQVYLMKVSEFEYNEKLKEITKK